MMNQNAAQDASLLYCDSTDTVVLRGSVCYGDGAVEDDDGTRERNPKHWSEVQSAGWFQVKPEGGKLKLAAPVRLLTLPRGELLALVARASRFDVHVRGALGILHACALNLATPHRPLRVITGFIFNRELRVIHGPHAFFGSGIRLLRLLCCRLGSSQFGGPFLPVCFELLRVLFPHLHARLFILDIGHWIATATLALSLLALPFLALLALPLALALIGLIANSFP
uniref:Uncharacterized protein n=1 Tax=Octactis speculum TaxID=3111310 RepID=A0A7S2MPP7_9STRA|mmetsp:Transcript_7908/g.9884  ORF Transcript_7908/g.9884 Transcript_7908/m.9884 type:complete len:226 (+) Transcript_7908:287-964(+)